jgi:N-acetyltransferase
MEVSGKILRFDMPQKLEGTCTLLIPLIASHTDELYETARDESIWKYYTFLEMKNKERFREFIDHSLEKMEEGSEFTFTFIDKGTGKMIGGSSYLDISYENRSLEIGRTWIAPRLHGTGFNTEVKYLMLSYCFDTLSLGRVFFKTDSGNERSKAAIQKIGAVYEGTLRNHMIREDGSYRHSAYYSIIDSEWQSVKNDLEKKLNG